MKYTSYPSAERVLSLNERREIVDLAWAVLLDEKYLLSFSAKILDHVRRKASGDNYVKFRRAWIFRIAIQQIYKSAIAREFSINSKSTLPEELVTEKSFRKILFQYPLETRLILILKHRFSFTDDEVGDILELSSGTISYRLDKVEKFIESSEEELDFINLRAENFPEDMINNLNDKEIKNIAKENKYKDKELPEVHFS